VDFEAARRSSSAESMARRGWKGSSYWELLVGCFSDVGSGKRTDVVLFDVTAVEALDVEECSV
jgi:hypothetical protein